METLPLARKCIIRRRFHVEFNTCPNLFAPIVLIPRRASMLTNNTSYTTFTLHVRYCAEIVRQINLVIITITKTSFNVLNNASINFDMFHHYVKAFIILCDYTEGKMFATIFM